MIKYHFKEGQCSDGGRSGVIFTDKQPGERSEGVYCNVSVYCLTCAVKLAITFLNTMEMCQIVFTRTWFTLQIGNLPFCHSSMKYGKCPGIMSERTFQSFIPDLMNFHLHDFI